MVRARGGDTAGGTAPGHDDRIRSEAAIENLVPADEPPAVGGEKGVHLLDEPALELVLGAVRVACVGGVVGGDAELTDLRLSARARFPLRLRGFIAADV